MRSIATRKGALVMSAPLIMSDFHRARSDEVGLSSAAKSVTVTSPFQVAVTGAPSGTSTASLPFAASVPPVSTTLTFDSTYALMATRPNPDASSCPVAEIGLFVIGPANDTRPRSPTRARSDTVDFAPRALDRSVTSSARSRTASLTTSCGTRSSTSIAARSIRSFFTNSVQVS